MEYVKPPRLRSGDSVAVVSTSWGGPHVFPHVFGAGIRALTHRFGLRVVEFPTARMAPDDLAADPRARAADLNAAFADNEIAAVICSIGGDDSARILRYLDADVIRSNPKIMMGFSDSTTQLVYAHQLGLVTFNGPAVMAGFAQLGNFAQAEAHIRSMLFEPTDRLVYEPYPHWVNEYAPRNQPDSAQPENAQPENAGGVGELRPHDGWHWLNGTGRRSGQLFGGCVEVLEFLKGTRWWPGAAPDIGADFWDDRILFLETSEDKPTVGQVKYWLFNYGVQGVFERAAGLIIGRARDYTDDDKRELDQMIVDTVVGQFGARDLPIVTNMDFGHTDPQWILPLGITAELDCNRRTFALTEAAVS